MTEYPGQSPMANPESVTAAEANQAAAQQIAAQAGSVAADAGPSVEAMQASQREVLLPMEQRIDALIKEFQTNRDAQAQQIADLQAQLAAARSDVGAPAVETYANGVATLVQAHADANPDVDRAKFAPALALAGQLKSAAADAVASRDPGELQRLSGQVRNWAARGVGKHLDLSGLHADLDLLDEAATRLAA